MNISINQKVIFAARSGNLKLLIERVKAGGDINYYDQVYGSALSEAIRLENEEIIFWLLNNGADPNFKFPQKASPLEVALYHQSNPKLVNLHINYGYTLKDTSSQIYKERLKKCLKSNDKALS